jgi:hypothetical protein
MSHASRKKSRGVAIMEATLTKVVAVESIAVETNQDELKELSNIELMLVGGGMANVSFM